MKNKTIAKRLVELKNEDQKLVTDLKAKKTDIVKLSRKHRAELKKIIKKIGWPTISKVGKEGSRSAWLIAQHSDRDVGFQEYCLNLMKNVPEGDVKSYHIAYLTDRILVNRRRKQIYGTQFFRNRKKELCYYPVRDFKNLEKRWKEMGVGGTTWKTQAAYHKAVFKLYQKDLKK